MSRRRYPLLAPERSRRRTLNPAVWLVLAAWAIVLVAALYIARELI